MCGIIVLLCHSNDEEMKRLVQGYYLKQMRQGSEGFGVLLRKRRTGRIYRGRTETSIEIFNDKIWKKVKAGDLLVFHHRNPTSTPNLPECNHPLSNEDKSIYLAHIGIIDDYYCLDYCLEKDHYFESEVEEITKTRNRTLHYRSYTDSELAVHRLEEILEEKDRASAMKQLGEEFYGSVFLAVFSDEHRIYLCSSGHNLWSYRGYIIASSKLWPAGARLIQYKYGYLCGKGLVTKDIKPAKSLIQYVTKKPAKSIKSTISCTYNREEEEKEFFYESALFDFLQSRSQSCGMGISYDCDNCPLREDCEEEFRMFYYVYS